MVSSGTPVMEFFTETKTVLSCAKFASAETSWTSLNMRSVAAGTQAVTLR